MVTFNNVAATVKLAAADGKSLTVTVPPTATTGAIAVTVNGIKVTSVDDFTVMVGAGDPYATVRVKEIDHLAGNGLHSKTEYYYNANNVLITEKQYYSSNGSYVLSTTNTYTYNAQGKILSKVGDSNTVAFKMDCTYDPITGNLQNIAYSQAAINGGVYGTYQLQRSEDYAFVNNQINTITEKDDQGIVTSVNTYTYSTTGGGDIQTTIHYNEVSSADGDYTTVYYNGLIDPQPLVDL